MKLILQADDIDIQASVIPRSTDITWFIKAFNLRPSSSSTNQPSFLRDAGVKRMRLSKQEEKHLGNFEKGESFTDGVFKYHFVLFEKGVALLATEEATTSCILVIFEQLG